MRFHSKYHNKNHHSNSTSGYPDSASDPIANKENPFEGDFYINGSLSANGNIVSELLSSKYISIEDFTVDFINVTSLSSYTISTDSLSVIDTINSNNTYTNSLTSDSIIGNNIESTNLSSVNINSNQSIVLTSYGDYLNYNRLSSTDIKSDLIYSKSLSSDDYQGLPDYSLSSLVDISLSALNNEDILKYNISNSKWENVKIAEQNIKRIDTRTASFSITSTEIHTYVINSDSAETIQLAEASTLADYLFNVKKKGLSTVTISGYGNELIDDSNTQVLSQNDNIILHCDGIQFYIL